MFLCLILLRPLPACFDNIKLEMQRNIKVPTNPWFAETYNTNIISGDCIEYRHWIAGSKWPFAKPRLPQLVLLRSSSFQCYLGAYFVANCTSVMSNFCKKWKSNFRQRQTEGLQNASELFIQDVSLTLQWKQVWVTMIHAKTYRSQCSAFILCFTSFINQARTLKDKGRARLFV